MRAHTSFVPALFALVVASTAGVARADPPVAADHDACPAFAEERLPDASDRAAYTARTCAEGGDYASDVAGGALPPGLSLTGCTLAGTPARAGPYAFSVKYSADQACPGFRPDFSMPGRYVAVRSHVLAVRDVRPPLVSAFNVTPSSLDAAGGVVAVEVRATDDVEVVKVQLTVFHPDGRTGSTLLQRGEVRGSWTVTIALPGNAARAPSLYRFSLSVNDAAQNATRLGPLDVTVGGRTEPRVQVPGG